jgi:hypothetical protein
MGAGAVKIIVAEQADDLYQWPVSGFNAAVTLRA